MNVTLSIDPEIVKKVRKRASSVGKTLNQVIREQMEIYAGGADAEAWIAEFKALSGKGDAKGWKFNRDEIHERS